MFTNDVFCFEMIETYLASIHLKQIKKEIKNPFKVMNQKLFFIAATSFREEACPPTSLYS